MGTYRLSQLIQLVGTASLPRIPDVAVSETQITPNRRGSSLASIHADYSVSLPCWDEWDRQLARVHDEGRRQDRKSEGMTEPMYRQIAEDLRARIESGAIAQGAKLPTESDLRVGYGAARNTVREAVRLLASRGLVETRPGLGTFVTRHTEPFITTLAAVPLPRLRATTAGRGDPADSAASLADDEDDGPFAGISAHGRTLSASGPQVSVQPASEDIAAWLRVPPRTQVVTRRREYAIDGGPWSLRTSYYPFQYVSKDATDLVRAESLPGGAASYLEQRLGLVQVGYQERILVRPPATDEAKFLELPDDGRALVVTVVRTCYRSAENGLAPLRVVVTVLPADRIVLVINSGTVPDEGAPDGHADSAVA
jgi:GntR family transcriptional regulator